MASPRSGTRIFAALVRPSGHPHHRPRLGDLAPSDNEASLCNLTQKPNPQVALTVIVLQCTHIVSVSCILGLLLYPILRFGQLDLLVPFRANPENTLIKVANLYAS